VSGKIAQRCEHSAGPSDLCWVFQPMRVSEPEVKFSLKETITRCLKCPAFEEALRRSTGRRESDQLLTLTLQRLLGQLVDYDTELSSITGSLQKKVEELAVLKAVSEALLKTQDLRKVLMLTLTGVTSGEAFGFNRAMVFLVNENARTLDGQLGLGHLEWSEAPQIWDHLSSQRLTFEQLVNRILKSDNLPDNNLTRFLQTISIPLNPEAGILPRALQEKRAFYVDCATEVQLYDSRLSRSLMNMPIAVIPIISEDKALGVILVDNSISKRPIREEDIATLQTLANQAAAKIENAMLHHQLEVRYAELRHIHSLLMENQSYLVKSERLADLGRLATTVAHEIKTPLITMGGYAQRMLRKVDQGLIERKDLEVIIEEITRLERICARMLDYSQKSQLHLEENDLNQIISETLRLENGKLRYENISLKTEFHPGKLTVLADRDRLKQVLYNLIQNAAEAIEESGTISIKTGTNGDFVYFQVSDDGCGMTEEIMSRLYQPFFTNKRNGTGLGLPVSKKIIEDHGGTIRIESAPRKGTTFTINLPCCAANH